MPVNRRLRDRRLELDMRVEDVARLAGVSEKTVSRAELGEPIRLLSQQRIATALNMARNQLFDEASDPAPATSWCGECGAVRAIAGVTSSRESGPGADIVVGTLECGHEKNFVAAAEPV